MCISSPLKYQYCNTVSRCAAITQKGWIILHLAWLVVVINSKQKVLWIRRTYEIQSEIIVHLSADLNAVICSLFVSCLFETTCKLVSGAGLKWPAAPSVLDEKIYCWSRWSVIATAAAAAEAAGQDAVIAMRSSALRASSAGGGCYWVRALSRKSERETPSAPPPPNAGSLGFFTRRLYASSNLQPSPRQASCSGVGARRNFVGTMTIIEFVSMTLDGSWLHTRST